MEELLTEYLQSEKLLKHEYEMFQIPSIVDYLNREITNDKVKGWGDVRNRCDAYNAIIEWNEKVDNLIDIRESLLKEYPHLPSLDVYKVKFDVSEHIDVVDILNNVNFLIKNNYMLIDTQNFHVAMLDSLYSKYEGQNLINFCKRLKIYCDTINSYKADTRKVNNNMLISLKDRHGEVKPFAYFTGLEVITY